MAGNSVAEWRCNRGHTLGVVRRNGRGIRQLIVFREAVPSTASFDFAQLSAQGVEMAEVDVVAVVEGFTPTVRCSICGTVRTWVPGKEAIEAMIERLRVRTVNHE